jgi:hypothetical protein
VARIDCKYQGKRLVLGLDEAGYGPNLGPMLVGGSAWLVPEELTETELLAAFRQGFSTRSWSPGCQHVPLGDSKELHQPSCGLQNLEAGLLAMLCILGPVPADLAGLIQLIGTDRDVLQPTTDWDLPWYQNLHTAPVPCHAEFHEDEVRRLASLARNHLESHGIQLSTIQARVVPEPEFNRRVEQLGSKGQLLSETTLRLASRLMADLPAVPIDVYCDRHGGRTNYLPLLLEWMPDQWFLEVGKSQVRCSYRTVDEPLIQIHFTVGGDSFPATGLASMTAKYLRERLMETFNAYWQSQCPGLKATAGYPVDARRFKKEIAPISEPLGLQEQLWWRCR